MVFKNPDNSFCFIMICIIVLFGVSNIILIGNAVFMSKRGSNPDYIYGFNYEFYYDPVYPDYWRFDFFDKKISNIENIVMMICMLWGFMRLIDLSRFLENYKKDEKIDGF